MAVWESGLTNLWEKIGEKSKAWERERKKAHNMTRLMKDWSGLELASKVLNWSRVGQWRIRRLSVQDWWGWNDRSIERVTHEWIRETYRGADNDRRKYLGPVSAIINEELQSLLNGQWQVNKPTAYKFNW